MMHRLILHVCLACGIVLGAISILQAKPKNAANLLTSPEVSTYSGSLSGSGLKSMFEGKDTLRRIRVCPHVLDIRWNSPVSANTFRVEWDSDEVYGRHYGLEYWDAPSDRFKLAFEERANRLATRTHRFKDIRTTRVRFTVFEHPQKYNSVVIKGLALNSDRETVSP